MDLSSEPLEETYIQHVIKEVLKALVFLNEICWIIHRDLKAASILLNKKGQIKLTDFANSAINSSFNEVKSTFLGSPNWISPEVIPANQNASGYNFKVDTWSLGITCIELAEFDAPYVDLEAKEAIQMIKCLEPPKLKQPEIWSHDFIDFVENCLIKNPHDRPCPHHLYKVYLNKTH